MDHSDLFWIIEADRKEFNPFYQWYAKATAVSRDGKCIHVVRLVLPRNTRLDAVGAMETYCIENHMPYTLQVEGEPGDPQSEENRADLENDKEKEKSLWN